MISPTSLSVVAEQAVPTLAWTLPSLAWMWWRIASILSRKGFVYHMLHGTKSFLFYVHVVTGIAGLLIATVGYVYYMIPLSEERLTIPFAEDPTCRLFFTASALVLILANLSILWLLPSVDDYKTYQVESPRPLVRGLTILHINSFQFSGMAATALAMIVPTILRQTLLILSILVYVAIVVGSILELRSVSWETTFYGQLYLDLMPNNREPWGKMLSFPSQQRRRRLLAPPLSKVTLAMAQSDGDAQVVMFAIFGVVGSIALGQCLCLLTVSERQQHVGLTNFFVASFLYQTCIMSAGFFTMTQLFFGVLEKSKNNKIVLDRQELLTLAGELFFLQVLPFGVLCLGPQYTGISNAWDFAVAYLTFR